MADDDPAVAARPPSRGPRVVTGDMLKARAKAPRVVTGAWVAQPPAAPTPDDDDATVDEATDDATTETLVGPGSSSTRPAPAATPAPAPEPPPRRPRAVTSRTPSPPAVAEPEAATEVRPTIPPPLHRATVPPPPPSSAGPTLSPPGKRAKPAKPPRAARTSSADGPGEPLAATAFILALSSLALAGLTAIPALVVAARAKRRIAGRPGASGSGLVAVARVVAVFALVAWLTVAGVVLASAVRPDGVDYAQLKPGDCFDTPEGVEVDRLTLRSCVKPHDAEVFAVVIHPAPPGEAFPGPDVLLEHAAAICLGQPFTDYVGIPRDQSALTEFEIVPESGAWVDGHRKLVSAVDAADRSPLTAPVRGSAK